MNDPTLSTRTRAFLSDRFLLIVGILLIVTSIFGLWAYQVNLVTEFDQQEQVRDQWEESTAYEHGTVITEDTAVWSEGEEVTDRPLYYTNVSSDLQGTYTYEYAADSGDLEVTTETYLTIRAIDDGGTEEVLWELSEPLETTSTDSLGPDDEHTVEFAVDVDEVAQNVTQIETQLGASEGDIDVRVVSTTDLEGQVQNDEIEQTYDSEMAILVDGSTFRVTDTEEVSEPHQTTDTVEVPVQPSTTEAVGSVLLFALALAALTGLVVGRNSGYIEISEEEREQLQFQRDRDRFDEWITTGTFPSEREYESTILVDDLTGLVDVAIDTNKRVIEDQQLEVSTVLDEDYVYIYVHPGSPARDWLVNYADTTMDEFERHDF